MSQRLFKLSTQKMGSLASFILFTLCLLISACQQTQIEFTDTQPPKLAYIHDDSAAKDGDGDGDGGNDESASKQNSESNGLPIAEIKLQLPNVAEQAKSINLNTLKGIPFQLHLFPEDNTGLNRLNLVALSPQRPFQEISVLAATLKEASLHLAAESPLNCIESLNSHATMHMINSEIRCDKRLDLTQAGTPLIQLWKSSTAHKLDTDKVSRTVKLNKHIGAFSGAEIETLWRKVILGKEHAYNQVLDHTELVDELSASQQQGEKLANLQRSVIAQSQWHILATDTGSLPALKQQAIELMSTLLDGQASAQLPSSMASHEFTSQTHQIESGITRNDKTIYLIDIPDTVQTQVRVGYQLGEQVNHPLPMKQRELGCISLAALLGRSYTGRLFYDLREQRGLTYGVYAHCLHSPLSMSFKIQGSTQIQHTGAFLAGILDHLDLIKDRVAPQQELDSVSTYLIGQEILAQSSRNNNRSGYIRQQLQPKIDKPAILAELATLSPTALQQLSQSLFSNPPYIVLRGDAELIVPDIKEKLPNWTVKVSSAN